MPNLPNAPRKYILVFGSNEGGFHGAGAARTARDHYGAVLGKGYGHYGNSFAIPTLDQYFKEIPLQKIDWYIKGFLAYADALSKVNFKITCIGTGLAHRTHKDIAPLFTLHPENCWFDTLWKPWLGDKANYWGTYP